MGDVERALAEVVRPGGDKDRLEKATLPPRKNKELRVPDPRREPGEKERARAPCSGRRQPGLSDGRHVVDRALLWQREVCTLEKKYFTWSVDFKY